MIKQAIILAGGFGTRLQQVVSEVPKPMAPVNSRPFLEYLLDYLMYYNVKEVILSVGYKAEAIKNHFRHRYRNVKINYAVEEEPLGTGGAIKKALGYCHDNPVLVLNGDTFFDVDLRLMAEFHSDNNADFTMAVRKVRDVQRYGCVMLNEESRITGFSEKNTQTGEGFINGGIYILSAGLLKKKSIEGETLPFFKGESVTPFSLEKDFLEKYYRDLNIFGFVSENYFIDIGIPEDYYKAQHDFAKFKY